VSRAAGATEEISHAATTMALIERPSPERGFGAKFGKPQQERNEEATPMTESAV
jgi:hypothetical protein